MPQAKAGEIKYYHESGSIFQVEVLDVRERNYGNSLGEEYRLKVLEVIDDNGLSPPSKGLEFSVWKSYVDGNYSCWHLLDS